MTRREILAAFAAAGARFGCSMVQGALPDLSDEEVQLLAACAIDWKDRPFSEKYPTIKTDGPAHQLARSLEKRGLLLFYDEPSQFASDGYYRTTSYGCAVLRTEAARVSA